MSAATPGPWTAMQGEAGTIFICPLVDGVAAVRFPLAKVFDFTYHLTGQHKAEQLANARLMAAAPALCDLLHEALDLVPRINDDDPMAPPLAEWLRRVRTTLANSTTPTTQRSPA